MKKYIKCHVKIGDRIQIISGNEKGKIGNISAINKKKGTVFVDTVLPRVKYLVSRGENQSKKVDLQIPIHISNVMLWDTDKNQASKSGYRYIDLTEQGSKKERYLKKSGKVV